MATNYIHASTPTGSRDKRKSSSRKVTGLSEKTESVQVATLLTVIGEEACEVFSMFSDWDHEGDSTKIGPVLSQYCQPRIRSRDIVSIAALRRHAKHTTSTALHLEKL